MNRKHKAMLISAAVLLASLFLVFSIAISSAGSNGRWSDVEIRQEYNAGSVFEVPTAELTVGGQTQTVIGILTYPNGETTSSPSVVLNQHGIYQVTYSAEAGDKVYTNTQEFVVRNDLIAHGENTTLSFGVPNTAETECLIVSLGKGEEITFAQYIDVSDLTKSTALIKCFLAPNTPGVADIDAIVFTLRDIEDPNVFVKIRGHRYVGKPGLCYFSAGGNGQLLTGFEQANNKLHINNEWGFATPLTFEAKVYDWGTGTANDRMSDQYIVALSLDYESKGVYIDSGNPSYSGRIIDLDNADYFETLWKGFTSQKVSLSVSAEGFNSENANICITEVLGTDITKYNEKVIDEEPPVITVDVPYDVIPEGSVGGTYPIPAATAKDIYSGKCDVEVNVLYNYTSTSPVSIAVSDGRFATDRAGYYAVIYTARDRFGNTAEEIIWVHAGREIAPITVIPPINLPTTAELGGFIPLDEASSVSGGSGEIEVSVQVLFGNEIIPADKGFVPEIEGNYTVTYTATDITGMSNSTSHNIHCVRGTHPVLPEMPVLPQLFFSGVKYPIPAHYAKDYSTGKPVLKLCSVTVIDAQGEHTYHTGEDFVPTVNENGDVITLIYHIDGYELAKVEIPAILVWIKEDSTVRLHVENYLYGAGFETVKTSDGMQIFSVETDHRWTFANALASEGFSVYMESIPEYGNFSCLTLRLTDSLNPENVIEAKLVQSAGGMNFIVGDETVPFEYNFGSSAKCTLKIGYSRNAISINGVKLPVSKTVMGEAFRGFASGMVYLSVEMNGAAAKAGYTLVVLNDYPLTTVTRDLVAPNIVITGDYGGSFTPGTEHTIPPAISSDVLSPFVTFSMTVKDPDGEIVRDKTGKLLENADPTQPYTILLDKLGQYRVSYTTQEDKSFVARPNSASFIYVINSEDNTAPDICFAKVLSSTAKVGEVITLPQYTVSDNLTAAEDIRVNIYVKNPNGKLITLTGNSIKPTLTGIYEFRIMVTDEYGNYTMKRMSVTVTE